MVFWLYCSIYRPSKSKQLPNVSRKWQIIGRMLTVYLAVLWGIRWLSAWWSAPRLQQPRQITTNVFLAFNGCQATVAADKLLLSVCVWVVERKRHIRNNNRSCIMKKIAMHPSQSALWNIHEPVNNNAHINLFAGAASRLCRPFPPQSDEDGEICNPQNITLLPLIWRESSSAAIFLAGWRERTAPSPGCRLPGSSHSQTAWAAKPTHTRDARKLSTRLHWLQSTSMVSSEINKTGGAIQFIWKGPLARRLQLTFYAADMVISSLYQHESVSERSLQDPKRPHRKNKNKNLLLFHFINTALDGILSHCDI